MNLKELLKSIRQCEIMRYIETIIYLVAFYIVYYFIVVSVVSKRGYFAIGGEVFIFIAFTVFSIVYPRYVCKKQIARIEEKIYYLDELMMSEPKSFFIIDRKSCFEIFFLKEDKLMSKKLRKTSSILDEEKISQIIFK